MTTLAALAAEPFVSLTTYRRSGEGVATPVWVVGDGPDLLVWTPARSGKVKRLRNDGRVDLVACGRRGAVAPDAPHVAASARIAGDAASLAAVERGLAGKYGVQYRVVTTLERVVDRVRRRHTDRVVIRVVATPPAA